VEQNLVDDRLDVGYRKQELKVLDGEAVNQCMIIMKALGLLGDTDRLDLTLLVQLLHLLPRTRNITFGDIGVMDEVEIDVLDAKLLERLFARLSSVLVIQTRPFGSEPVLFSS